MTVARQLCTMLAIEASAVNRILWCDFLHEVRLPQKFRVTRHMGPFSGHMLSAHFPTLIARALVLREMMRGKLEVDEWEPLMCSSLIFYNQFRWQRYTRWIVSFSPLFAVVVVAIGSWIANRFLSGPLIPLEYGIVLLVVLLVSPFLPGMYLVRHFDRRLVLAADQKTSTLLGRQGLLHALQKVDVMRQSDVERGNTNEWEGLYVCARDNKENRSSSTAPLKNAKHTIYNSDQEYGKQWRDGWGRARHSCLCNDRKMPLFAVTKVGRERG